MGQELLVIEQIDAGADFIRDFSDYRSVAVACWINPTESNNLFLYIASDEIDDSNFDVAYGEVLRRLSGTNRSPWLDPFQIKLVNSGDPIARDAIEIRDRYPTKAMGTRYNGPSIGGTSIDGAYIYASLAASKSTP